MTTRPVAVVLAALAGVLVLLRVVWSSVAALVTAPGVDVVTAATVVLLVAGLAFVAAATWFALAEDHRAARLGLTRALVGFLAVMAGYLVLGLALGRHVPWTAYAVLVGVAVLGSAAVVVDRRSEPAGG